MTARPHRMASRRMAVWEADDVQLFVEVSDETLQADLTTKARVYAAAGSGAY